MSPSVPSSPQSCRSVLSATPAGLWTENNGRSSAFISLQHISVHTHVRLPFCSLAWTLLLLSRRVRRQKRYHAASKIQNCFRRYRQRVMFQQVRNHVIKIQQFVRQRTDRKRAKEQRVLMKCQQHRSRVLMELYTTEQSYVSKLDIIVKFYLKPLRALEKNVGLTQEQIGVIFGNVEEILGRHIEVRDKLEKELAEFNEQSLVSHLYLELCNLIPIYTTYCNNYDVSKQMLDKCYKIPAFHNFLDTVQNVKTLKRLDLNSYLILPIQRIPRYELLLKDLIKHTWATHNDYENLNAAYTKLRESIKQLDRAKAFSESRQQLQNLQRHLSRKPSLALAGSSRSLATDRVEGDCLEKRYISQGELKYREISTMWYNAYIKSLKDPKFIASPTKEKVSSDEKLEPVTAFLFTDVLLLATKSKEGAINKYLNRSKLPDLTHSASISLYRSTLDTCIPVNKSKDQLHSFILTSGTGVHYLFVAETIPSKSKWIADLEEALENTTKEERRFSATPDIYDLMTIGSEPRASVSLSLSTYSDVAAGDAGYRTTDLSRSASHVVSSSSQIQRKPSRLFKSQDAIESILKTVKQSTRSLGSMKSLSDRQKN